MRELAFQEARPIDCRHRPVIIVVMGVSGSGKSTISALLSGLLHCEFQEGDNLHTKANLAKMHAGVALTDAERLPWLGRIAQKIDRWHALGLSGVISCSALKRSYRDIIMGRHHTATLVYLQGSYDLIRSRLDERRGHFMPPSLLASQFAALAVPSTEEHPICIDVAGRPREIVDEIMRRLEPAL